MKSRKLWAALFAASFMASVPWLSSCGTSDTATTTDYSYQGIGSKWTASFTGGTNFTITYATSATAATSMTVSGTYVEYSNKFRKLTVVSSSGTGPGGAAPAAGETAYGLEIPGYAFFLKPMGQNSEPIVMVNAGSCPTTDFVANWVIAKYQTPTSSPTASSDASGTATFSLSGATKTATIVQHRFDTGAQITGSNTITLTTCSAGAQTFTETGGSGGGTLYLTANGGALVNPGSGIIFASPQGSADASSSDWNGTYSGLVFNDSGSGSDKIFPAKIVLSGTAGTGNKITDVANDTVDASNSITISSLATVSGTKGLFHGVVNGGTAGPLNCVTSTIAGKKLLACNGAGGAVSSGVYPVFFYLGVAR